jgi:hypothetical protein
LLWSENYTRNWNASGVILAQRHDDLSAFKYAMQGRSILWALMGFNREFCDAHADFEEADINDVFGHLSPGGALKLATNISGLLLRAL